MKSFIETLKEAQSDKPEQTAEVETSKLASSSKSPQGKKILNALTKGRTIGGDTPTAIDVNPQYIIRADGIKEETVGRTAVFSFGRLNPPTIGHEKLVNAIQSEAKKVGGTPMLFLSRTEGDAKNPLPYSKKNRFAKMAFPIVKDTPSNMMPAGFIGLLKHLEDQYDNVVIVVGSDRLPNIEKLATKYNGSEYKYKNIKVVSAGERDPDEEGVGGMSASKMRKAALDGDFNAFKSGLPKRLKGVAKTVFDELVKSLNEEVEIDEAVLTLSQRLKRRSQLRRNKGKIRMGQKRALARKATSKAISRRSKRIAIKLIRKRILRGRKYQDLSYAARAAVDRQVARRKSAISRIAKRIEPKLRQAEGRRKSGQGFKSISLSAQPVKKKLKEELSRDNLIQVVTEMFTQISEEVRIPLTAVETATLQRKCNESNHSFETLRTVFDRGVASWYAGLREGSTPQQWGFARVNSFIAGGKSRYTADRDLLEAKDDGGTHEKLAIISNKETTSKQLVGFLKNSTPEIAQAAKAELEKRRDSGDADAGTALDGHEEQNPPEQQEPKIVSQTPKFTTDLASKMADILKTGLKESADKAVGNVPVINAKPLHHKASGHKYHVHHMMNPDLALKHQVKHAEAQYDRDVDSDIDQFDKPSSTLPDEVSVPTKGSTKQFFDKYKKERAHIHAGEPIDECDCKVTGDEGTSFADIRGNKISIAHNSDLKNTEDVKGYIVHPTPNKNFGKVMSMADFLKTQPEKKQ